MGLDAPKSNEMFAGNNWELPTDIHLVDSAADAFVDRLVEAGWDRESDNVFYLQIAFREALANAIAHGNLGVAMPENSDQTISQIAEAEQERNPSEKKVHVDIEVDDRKVSVTITDEGTGFDFENPPNVAEGEKALQASGRGIMVMKGSFDSVAYSKEAGGGTRVTMTKERQEESAISA
ncbi:MAG TPA: ATP-binding protein [Candidatus Paceibacterota bacterium]